MTAHFENFDENNGWVHMAPHLKLPPLESREDLDRFILKFKPMQRLLSTRANDEEREMFCLTLRILVREPVSTTRLAQLRQSQIGRANIHAERYLQTKCRDSLRFVVIWHAFYYALRLHPAMISE